MPWTRTPSESSRLGRIPRLVACTLESGRLGLTSSTCRRLESGWSADTWRHSLGHVTVCRAAAGDHFDCRGAGRRNRFGTSTASSHGQDAGIHRDGPSDLDRLGPGRPYSRCSHFFQRSGAADTKSVLMATALVCAVSSRSANATIERLAADIVADADRHRGEAA